MQKWFVCDCAWIFLWRHASKFKVALLLTLSEFSTLTHFVPRFPYFSMWLRRAGFPIQESRAQNHRVAPRSTQPFILRRSIKWVPGISENWMVKSKLPPRSGCSWTTSIKGVIKFFRVFYLLEKNQLVVSKLTYRFWQNLTWVYTRKSQKFSL